MKQNSCFHIPEDLLLEILPRLPTKTLARLMCVSKQWKCLILNQIPGTNHKLLIISYDCDEIYKLNSVNHETHVQSVHGPLDEHLLREHWYFGIHSSLNGLLLIQIDRDLFLLNPLTNYFQKVHTYPKYIYPELDYLSVDLCFDFVNNSYKFVLVEKVEPFSYWLEHVYVSAFGSSSWEEICVADHIGNFVSGPFVNGHRHWICQGYNDYSLPPNHIVYFDPKKNEFIELPKPQPKNGDRDRLTGLGVLDGCLCLTRFDNIGDYEDYFYNLGDYEGNIEFLVMKEYGSGDTWDIMFTISYTPTFRSYGNIEPLFKTKKGELLVSMAFSDDFQFENSRRYNQTRIRSYDANGNFLKDIWVQPDDYVTINVTLYKESWSSPCINNDQNMNFDLLDL